MASLRFSLLLLLPLAAAAAFLSKNLLPSDYKRARCGPNDLSTPWAALVNASANPLPEYPRPQLTRPGFAWASLNGLHEFQIASDHAGTPANPIPFNTSLPATILLPFPPESCLSGVGAFQDFPRSTPNFTFTWTRSVFDAPFPLTETTILNVEACDWNCTLWLNGRLLASHQGGYDAFSADVSGVLRARANELLIFAHDPTERGAQPQGKQLTLDILKHHVDGNKYLPTSGVWGDVWLEAAPARRVADVRLRTNATSLFLWLQFAGFDPAAAPQCALNISIALSGTPVAAYAAACSSAAPAILTIPLPALWAPGSPTLYTARIGLQVGGAGAKEDDVVGVYFGLREVALLPYSRGPVPALGPLFNTSIHGVGRPQKLKTGAGWRDCKALCGSGCEAWTFDGGAEPPTCSLGGADGTLPLVPNTPFCVSGKKAVAAGPAARPGFAGIKGFAIGWLDQCA